MKEIYFQLNSLTVLTGISIAIIQYIFTNHQNTLKDILLNLSKINFKNNNTADNELKKKWEDTIQNCKTHTYFVNPNLLIGLGFVFIILISVLFIFVLFDFNLFSLTSASILKAQSIVFLAFLLATLLVIYQIFSKEYKVKKKFKKIRKQHQLIERILD